MTVIGGLQPEPGAALMGDSGKHQQSAHLSVTAAIPDFPAKYRPRGPVHRTCICTWSDAFATQGRHMEINSEVKSKLDTKIAVSAAIGKNAIEDSWQDSIPERGRNPDGRCWWGRVEEGGGPSLTGGIMPPGGP